MLVFVVFEKSIFFLFEEGSIYIFKIFLWIWYIRVELVIFFFEEGSIDVFKVFLWMLYVRVELGVIDVFFLVFVFFVFE